jgi:thymidylate synthase (FAD)
MNNELKWKKHYPLSDKNAYICLVDCMGDDNSIVQAARVSYDGDALVGKSISDRTKNQVKKKIENDVFLNAQIDNVLSIELIELMDKTCVLRVIWKTEESTSSMYDHYDVHMYDILKCMYDTQINEDRQLLRYLLAHGHTTPFEMVEVKFMIQVPMDCWRQWIRHRTANVNEYSTRYTEAIDAMQTTLPNEWRLQSKDNKQGSSGFLSSDSILLTDKKGGDYFSANEIAFHEHAKHIYKERLDAGIAKEQARKDLPLSTYTRAYWKCDLHNIFNFLRLRMDSHAQLEIRSFANSMFEIVKQLYPVACEAFEDYVLHAKRFSRMEMEVILKSLSEFHSFGDKPDSMTDREWKEFLAKLS